ncbi:MAG TPA: hypothetical protein VNA27_16870 [Rubrobacteraceae bacterium]|nr:hypothetical protein [Rubrobacteraceae bacterium]
MDDEVALKAGFRGARHMRQELEELGFPEWFVEGDTPPNPKRSADGGEQKPRRRRRAKQFGENMPLPPAEGAARQFKRTLQMLIKGVDKLHGLEEYIQSERFVGVSERNGKNRAWGARQSPPEPLATLIDIEALTAGYARSPAMTWLLRALHPSELIEERKPYRGGTLTTHRPDPTKVNLAQLQEQMEKLREHADNVAKLVRGREKIRKGPSTGELTPREHSAYNVIKRQAQEEASETEIQEEVNRRLDRGPLAALHPEADDFTLEEIRRLRSLPFDGGA